ncbi:helix-turn-helix transcriptional regulator [Embleya sp. NBC_00896]|uniref:helix-turn-helix transcriptional regulator n=1 Tax=Embleya sp. NBC_00896 TaxID=2975961 RepID=UPI00386A6B37|nr:helix-turn-helix domain-containing protein [Embleya sp. NBC_00896]
MARSEKPIPGHRPSLVALAQWLRAARNSTGMTYTQMATAVEYSASTLSRAATGCVVPSDAVVEAYARACGADVEEGLSLLAVVRAEDDLDGETAGASLIQLSEISNFAMLCRAMTELFGQIEGGSLRSIEKVAAVSGTLPRSTLSRVLRGAARPRLDLLITFVGACGVSACEQREWCEAWHRADTDARMERVKEQMGLH